MIRKSIKNMSKTSSSQGQTKKLSPKRQLFLQEYLVDLNATQAYIRAGYSPNGAGQSAERLLKHADIQRHINQMREEKIARCEVSAANVVAAIARIGLAELSQLINPDGSKKPFSELTEEQRSWIGIRQSDRLKALDLLSRHLGLFEKDFKSVNRFSSWSKEEMMGEIHRLTKKMGCELRPLKESEKE